MEDERRFIPPDFFFIFAPNSMSGINQIVLLLISDYIEATLRDLRGPNSVHAYDISKVLGSSLELSCPDREELITVLLFLHI